MMTLWGLGVTRRLLAALVIFGIALLTLFSLIVLTTNPAA
jgi:hypothetical protein